MDNLNDLYELCETISEAIKNVNEKIGESGGHLSSGDLDYVDKITHALKSIKATIMMMEEEEGSSRMGSYEGSGRSNYGGNRSYRRSRNSFDGSYRRGMNSMRNRDSMGRFSHRGSYSGNEEYMETLRDAMESAPDDKSRQMIERMIQQMEEQ